MKYFFFFCNAFLGEPLFFSFYRQNNTIEKRPYTSWSQLSRLSNFMLGLSNWGGSEVVAGLNSSLEAKEDAPVCRHSSMSAEWWDSSPAKSKKSSWKDERKKMSFHIFFFMRKKFDLVVENWYRVFWLKIVKSKWLQNWNDALLTLRW